MCNKFASTPSSILLVLEKITAGNKNHGYPKLFGRLEWFLVRTSKLGILRTGLDFYAKKKNPCQQNTTMEPEFQGKTKPRPATHHMEVRNIIEKTVLRKGLESILEWRMIDLTHCVENRNCSIKMCSFNPFFCFFSFCCFPGQVHDQ